MGIPLCLVLEIIGVPLSPSFSLENRKAARSEEEVAHACSAQALRYTGGVPSTDIRP